MNAQEQTEQARAFNQVRLKLPPVLAKPLAEGRFDAELRAWHGGYTDEGLSRYIRLEDWSGNGQVMGAWALTADQALQLAEQLRKAAQMACGYIPRSQR